MKYSFNLHISNILLLFLWCILINKVSYTEELALSLIYIVLFIIISENTKEVIKELMINQTLKLIFCYEQLIYLKVKMIVKSLKLFKILIQKKNIRNINNIINYELKKKKQNNIDTKKKINNIRKINYIFFFYYIKYINNKINKMIEYYKILIMFIICVILAVLILGLSYILKSKNYNWEKISAYECGFQPFEDTRSRFDVKFYLVAILFIIFDLEIAYLFPWALSIKELNIEGVISMIIFLFVLTIGFVYEWKKGALDWY